MDLSGNILNKPTWLIYTGACDAMRRSFHAFGYAALGWLSLCAASNIASQERPIISHNRPARSIADISRSPVPYAACDNNDRKRTSELCAAWVSADASREAARYAFWSLVVGSIGTALLIWTLWETRANARRELRAYVSARVATTEINVISNGGFNFKPDGVLNNGGSTPAYNCVSFANVIAATYEDAKAYLKKPLPIEDKALLGGAVIHSGQDFPTEFNRVTTIPMVEIDEVLNGKRSLFLYGVCSYVDTFKVRRRTDFCFMLLSEDFRSAYLNSSENGEKPFPINWKVANFHNTAT
jgi:hypothetical protein